MPQPPGARVAPFRIVASPGAVAALTDLFPCARLGCSKVLASSCIARQEAYDADVGTSSWRDSWRGVASRYASCASWRCEAGRRIRALLRPPVLPVVAPTERRARDAGREAERSRARRRRAAAMAVPVVAAVTLAAPLLDRRPRPVRAVGGERASEGSSFSFRPVIPHPPCGAGRHALRLQDVAAGVP